MSLDNRRDRKTEEKDEEREDTEPGSDIADFRLIVYGRVFARKKEKQDSPEPPAIPECAHRQERRKESPGDPLVVSPQQRIGDVTAIQLTHRKQIQRSREHSHPGCAGYGMQVNIRRWNSRKNYLLQEQQKRRRAQLNGALMIDAGDHLGEGQPYAQRRNQKDKT